MSTAKPLSANQVSSRGFHYQDAVVQQDSMNGIANVDQSTDSFGSVKQNSTPSKLENHDDEFLSTQ